MYQYFQNILSFDKMSKFYPLKKFEHVIYGGIAMNFKICILIVLTLAFIGLAEQSLSQPENALIAGKIENANPKTHLVVPCLIINDNVCQIQRKKFAIVSESRSFEITVVPGFYTFLYGPLEAENTRSIWEGKTVAFDNADSFAHSFDPKAKPEACRYLSTGIKDEKTGLYEAVIYDTVWLESVALQIVVPGGFEWKRGAQTFAGGGAPLRIEAKRGEVTNVTLRGLGCKK